MIQKATYKISGMHCTACAMDIDGMLEETEGVKQSNTSYAKQEIEIEFEVDKITPEQIVEIVKTLGYQIA